MFSFASIRQNVTMLILCQAINAQTTVTCQQEALNVYYAAVSSYQSQVAAYQIQVNAALVAAGNAAPNPTGNAAPNPTGLVAPDVAVLPTLDFDSLNNGLIQAAVTLQQSFDAC